MLQMLRDWLLCPNEEVNGFLQVPDFSEQAAEDARRDRDRTWRQMKASQQGKT
jgi:hypothetical protein